MRNKCYMDQAAGVLEDHLYAEGIFRDTNTMSNELHGQILSGEWTQSTAVESGSQAVYSKNELPD